jgi:hypothetical protein
MPTNTNNSPRTGPPTKREFATLADGTRYARVYPFSDGAFEAVTYEKVDDVIHATYRLIGPDGRVVPNITITWDAGKFAVDGIPAKTVKAAYEAAMAKANSRRRNRSARLTGRRTRTVREVAASVPTMTEDEAIALALADTEAALTEES